jgi:hypothetical protein
MAVARPRQGHAAPAPQRPRVDEEPDDERRLFQHLTKSSGAPGSGAGARRARDAGRNVRSAGWLIRRIIDPSRAARLRRPPRRGADDPVEPCVRSAACTLVAETGIVVGRLGRRRAGSSVRRPERRSDPARPDQVAFGSHRSPPSWLPSSCRVQRRGRHVRARARRARLGNAHARSPRRRTRGLSAQARCAPLLRRLRWALGRRGHA